MKPPACAERHSHRQNRSARAPRGPRRECVVLRDLTDCLLQAYECVARRAYEMFLERGSRPGRELEDWLRAEHELLRNLPADIEETEDFVYVLASIPALSRTDLSVGIESRWVAILAHEAADEGIGHFLADSEAPKTSPSAAGDRDLADKGWPAQSLCVLELPVAVNPERSIAVLSHGLLGIRMPKIANA